MGLFISFTNVLSLFVSVSVSLALRKWVISSLYGMFGSSIILYRWFRLMNMSNSSVPMIDVLGLHMFMLGIRELKSKL
jgi:hypothetical protein